MDGRPCGPGTLKYSHSMPGNMGAEYEEATYEGNFKGGKREGHGVMTWADGSTYTGLWKNDKRINGEMKMQNGNIYRGTFSNDKINGHGKLLIPTGLIFEGEFIDGHCASVGKLLYANGDCYFGQHKAFVREG